MLSLTTLFCNSFNFKIEQLLSQRRKLEEKYGYKEAVFHLLEETPAEEEKLFLISDPSEMRGIKKVIVSKGYYLYAVIDLKQPMYELYIFTKNNLNKLKIGFFKKLDIYVDNPKTDPCDYIKTLEYKKDVPYNASYKKYLKSLDEFLFTDKKSISHEDFYLNTISPEYALFDSAEEYPATEYYDFLEKIKNEEDCIPLKDTVDIVKNVFITDKNVKVIESFYPLTYRTMNLHNQVSYKVKKGDIVNCSTEKYLIDEDPDPDSYVIAGNLEFKLTVFSVMRPKNISPYYMAVYLNSQIFRKLMGPYFRYTSYESKERDNALNILPVIKPDLNEEHYKTIFEFLYLNKGSIESYYKDNKNELVKKGKGFFNIELKQNDSIIYMNKSQEIIENDLKELQLCFKAKAYKATLIMAGSILEAFLIDWLSELKQKDFFEISYKVPLLNKKGKRIYNKGFLVKRKASLYDYIREVKVLKDPDWDEGFKDADFIREKRNLVHAKLFMNQKEINQETCVKVIEYLKYVISTRWKNKIDKKYQ